MQTNKNAILKLQERTHILSAIGAADFLVYCSSQPTMRLHYIISNAICLFIQGFRPRWLLPKVLSRHTDRQSFYSPVVKRLRRS